MSKKLNDKISEQELIICNLKSNNELLRGLLEVVIVYVDSPENGLFQCIETALQASKKLSK